MNQCDISIRFRFDDETLTDEIINMLYHNPSPVDVFVDADEHIHVAPTRGGGSVRFGYSGKSFDDVVVPFQEDETETSERQQNDATDLLVNFSTRDRLGIKTLILELLDTAIRQR